MPSLSTPTDRFHQPALTISDRLEAEGTRLITTREVLIEIGNARAKRRYRALGVELLDSIESDPSVTVLSMSDPIYFAARDLYRNRADKDWGLTDCISFVVMQSRRLQEALTSDVHFQQAGFRALLREATST